MPATNENLFNRSDFPILDVDEGIKTTGTEDMLKEMLKLMIEQSLPEDLTKMNPSSEFYPC